MPYPQNRETALAVEQAVRGNGLESPLRADTVEEIVDFLQARESLQLDGGVLVANPVPLEAEIPQEEMQAFITQAIGESQVAGISGKAMTPWLLGRIVEITEGRSLATNQALIINNAKLAAQLAVAQSQR